MNKRCFFGLHAVESLLQHHPDRILRLCVQQGRQDKKMNVITSLADQHHISVEILPRAELDRLTQSQNHQGIVAFCHAPRVYSEGDLPSILQKTNTPPFLLVLDGIQDPHNLGACFRCADAAGVHAIIAPKDKSVSITPVVSKVASGAVETIPFVQVTNLVRTLEKLKNLKIWIYGADERAEQTIYQTDLSGPIAIVLGAEGAGMRRLTREHCDFLSKIPMQGSVESLNISVAAGIFLFEAVRQRTAT